MLGKAIEAVAALLIMLGASAPAIADVGAAVGQVLSILIPGVINAVPAKGVPTEAKISVPEGFKKIEIRRAPLYFENESKDAFIEVFPIPNDKFDTLEDAIAYQRKYQNAVLIEVTMSPISKVVVNSVPGLQYELTGKRKGKIFSWISDAPMMTYSVTCLDSAPSYLCTMTGATESASPEIKNALPAVSSTITGIQKRSSQDIQPATNDPSQ